jgi:hypothetical protein
MAPAMAALLQLNVGQQRQQTDAIMQIIHLLNYTSLMDHQALAYSCKGIPALNVMA